MAAMVSVIGQSSVAQMLAAVRRSECGVRCGRRSSGVSMISLARSVAGFRMRLRTFAADHRVPVPVAATELASGPSGWEIVLC